MNASLPVFLAGAATLVLFLIGYPLLALGAAIVALFAAVRSGHIRAAARAAANAAVYGDSAAKRFRFAPIGQPAGEYSLVELRAAAAAGVLSEDDQVGIVADGSSFPAGRIPGLYSRRGRWVALLLALVIGTLGIHRFYVGKIGTGVLMFLTLGGLGIWTMIDIVRIAIGSFRDEEELILPRRF
jgi:hypothetical protein